jgi:hypothetical protein
MSMRQRLRRLEERHGTKGTTLAIACVDEAGCILDDGSKATRPWIGWNYQDVPGGILQVIVNADPLEMLGLKSSLDEGPPLAGPHTI